MYESNQNSKVRSTVTRCLQKRPYRTCGLTLMAIIAIASVVAGCSFGSKTSMPAGSKDTTERDVSGTLDGGGGRQGGGGGGTHGGGGSTHSSGTQGSGGGTGSGDESAKKFLEKHFSASDPALLKSNGMEGDVAKLFKGETLDEATKVQLWGKAFRIGLVDSGKATLVKKLAEAGVDPNTKIDGWELPICHAMSTDGYDETFKVLLNSPGINLEQTQKGATPLCIAITTKKHDKVSSLLAKGAQTAITCADGATPLSLALESRTPDIVAAVLDAKPDLNKTYGSSNENILHLAAKADPTCAKQLFIKGRIASEDMVKLAAAKNQPGATPLHLAALKGNYTMVKALVDLTKDSANNLDVNVKSNIGLTALHLAARKRNEAIVKFLVEEGKANVDVKNNDGHTPADLAKGENAEAIRKS